MILAKLKGYLFAGLAFLGVLAAAYLRGQSNAKSQAREAALKQKVKINDALKKTEQRNERDTLEATKKAESGDFSGFNRKPDRMRDDSTET